MWETKEYIFHDYNLIIFFSEMHCEAIEVTEDTTAVGKILKILGSIMG